MNTTKQVRNNRVRARLTVVAAFPFAAVTILGGAALATDDDDRPIDDDRGIEVVGEDRRLETQPEIPIWVQAAEHVRLCQLAAELPPNWPTAEVLRRQAERPLGDAADRARWRREAALMPAYWPATQVKLAGAEQRWDCSLVS